MITFKSLPKKELIGKILKICLPKNIVSPILQGPNKGFKRIVGSGVAENWLGTYELKKQKVISSMIKEKMVCYDIGAHAGFYTLLFSKCVGPKGKVFSFEPNPINISFLLKHLKLNKIKNTKVLPIALWYKEDHIPLTLNSFTSHLSRKKINNLIVPTFRVDYLVSRGTILPPDLIKIDVEGAEPGVLKGMEKVLGEYSPTIFVALDSKEKRKNIFNFLKKMKYKILNLEMKKIDFYQISEISEIVAVK